MNCPKCNACWDWGWTKAELFEFLRSGKTCFGKRFSKVQCAECGKEFSKDEALLILKTEMMKGEKTK